MVHVKLKLIFMTRLAKTLSHKWNIPFCRTFFFIKSRMSLAMLRLTTHVLCGGQKILEVRRQYLRLILRKAFSWSECVQYPGWCWTLGKHERDGTLETVGKIGSGARNRKTKTKSAKVEDRVRSQSLKIIDQPLELESSTRFSLFARSCFWFLIPPSEQQTSLSTSLTLLFQVSVLCVFCL